MRLKIPGHVTAAEARSMGFTHHGSYYGIPLWLGNVASPVEPLMITVKWQPLDLLLTPFHCIEGAVQALMYPDDPPFFQFKVGAEIDGEE